MRAKPSLAFQYCAIAYSENMYAVGGDVPVMRLYDLCMEAASDNLSD